MTGIVTQQFRIFYAEQFKELFDEPINDNVYVFIGRTSPWSDDNFPPTPIDSVGRSRYSIWNDIISVKKILPTDVSFATNRYNWTTGTVYAQYTANTAFHENAFYVMNNEFQVYKCLYNNKGAQSTIKPTGRLTIPFTTADGYKWKFMTEIPAAEAVKYITTDFIPVKKLDSDDGSYQWDVQQAAVNGSILTVGVAAGGNGYKSLSGSVVSANSTTVILAPGANTVNGTYTGSSIYISSGTGAGQLKKINGYNGGALRVQVDTPFSPVPVAGSTYIVSPTVNVSKGDGTGFRAYSTVSNGSINSVEVVSGGQNYGFANLAVTANATTGGSGGSLLAQIPPYGGHGSNPVYELYGHNIIMNVTLDGSEAGAFFANNDYRVIGLIANPLLADGVTVANGSTYMVAPQLTLTSQVSTFSADEAITGGTSGATGTFVEYSNSSVIVVTNTVGTFTTETITGGTSGATASVTSVTANPLKKYSGRVLYVENREPIIRSELQTEDLRIILTL